MIGGNIVISIVIPSYNRDADLERCLASIRENSVFTGNEVLILTPTLARGICSIGQKYGCRLFADNSRSDSKRVRSLWAIINRGIDLSMNNYVVWLNDDCTVEPNWDKAAMEAAEDDVGLVVFRARGIAGHEEFRTVDAMFGVPCANYGMLRKDSGVRFDEKFSWFHADSDIPLQMLSKTNFRVVIARGNLIIHLHRLDQNRSENENDVRTIADKVYFDKKWRRSKMVNGRIMRRTIFEYYLAPLFRALIRRIATGRPK